MINNGFQYQAYVGNISSFEKKTEREEIIQTKRRLHSGLEDESLSWVESRNIGPLEWEYGLMDPHTEYGPTYSSLVWLISYSNAQNFCHWVEYAWGSGGGEDVCGFWWETQSGHSSPACRLGCGVRAVVESLPTSPWSSARESNIKTSPFFPTIM